jgi:hypothetical protein
MTGRLVVRSDRDQPKSPCLSSPHAISARAIPVEWQAGRATPTLDLNVLAAGAGRCCRKLFDAVLMRYECDMVCLMTVLAFHARFECFHDPQWMHAWLPLGKPLVWTFATSHKFNLISNSW